MSFRPEPEPTPSSPDHVVSVKLWKQFFRLYVIISGHRSYFEYKFVSANRELLRRLGEETYYLLIIQFLYEYTSTLLKTDFTALAEDNAKLPAQPVNLLSRRLKAIKMCSQRVVHSLFTDDDSVVLFNNSINTDKIEALKYLNERSVYISVNRSILDQMADQRRSNVFFANSAVTFAHQKYKKLARFRLVRDSLGPASSVKFYDLSFEG